MRSDDTASLPDSGPSAREIVSQTVGQVVSRVDRLYGGAVSLHLGAMVPGRRRDRGTWIVTAWGADLLMNDVRLDHESDAITTLLPEVQQLTGQRVREASLELRTGELQLTFDGGNTVRLVPDSGFDGDAWTLSLLDGRTLCVSSRGDWSVKTEDAVRQ
jgi:hypothetical protein